MHLLLLSEEMAVHSLPVKADLKLDGRVWIEVIPKAWQHSIIGVVLDLNDHVREGRSLL